MVTPTRFERVAPRLGIWCSILLSYGVTAGVAQRAHSYRPRLLRPTGTDEGQRHIARIRAPMSTRTCGGWLAIAALVTRGQKYCSKSGRRSVGMKRVREA